MYTDDGYYSLIPKTKPKKERINTDMLIFRHGHIAITNYKLGDNREFEKSLSTFDEITWKYTLKGGYYCENEREFRVNRGYNLAMLVEFFPNHKPTVINEAYKSPKIPINLLVAPRDDFQKVAITFMCSQGRYKKNASYTQQIIDADVGDGKTYCGVAASAFFSARTVVVVPFGKLLAQWLDSYTRFSDVTESEVLQVRGSKLCHAILNGEYEHIKIFIFSIDTIESFRKSNGDDMTMDLMRATKAYLKIVDEVHKDIKAISMLEAMCNFRMNLYMSATPGRADKKENWIFKTLFTNIPRFGGNFKSQSEKHINVMVKQYKFTPTAKQVGKMVNRRTKWLNSKAYETELFTAPAEQSADFDNSLRSMLGWSKKLLKKGNKILIMTGTVAGTEYTANIAKQVFPDHKVSRYWSKLKPSEKEEALESDIICSTVTSLGTGADIKGVQHVYNCSTYSNWVDAHQTSGRARKLPDGTAVWYIELVNLSYIKTMNQFEARKPHLLKISPTSKIVMVE